jgi:hypothetical protein
MCSHNQWEEHQTAGKDRAKARSHLNHLCSLFCKAASTMSMNRDNFRANQPPSKVGWQSTHPKSSSEQQNSSRHAQ